MEQKVKLNWKKFSNTSVFQILFDKENTLFLQNIFSHKLTEFEIENLPSFYIISFVEVLQNYIFYFLKNEQNQNNINNTNEYEQIINSQNEKIQELNEKMINLQEVINQKDMALNQTHKNLVFIYNRYNQLQEEYDIKMENFIKNMKEKENDYKDMGDKLIDTFSYLNKLVMISNINNEPIKEKENELKPKERSHQNLITVKTYQEEGLKYPEKNIKKQTSLVPKKKKKRIENIE